MNFAYRRDVIPTKLFKISATLKLPKDFFNNILVRASVKMLTYDTFLMKMRTKLRLLQCKTLKNTVLEGHDHVSFNGLGFQLFTVESCNSYILKGNRLLIQLITLYLFYRHAKICLYLSKLVEE